jgi:predicted nucleotidyltransferase
MRVSPEQIIGYVDRIVAEFQPDRVILFGSYAYGEPTADSDVDLLVVMPYKGRPYRKAAAIASRCPDPFPMDMLVRSRDDVRRRVAMNDWFMREVVEKGVVLYDADDKRVGVQGRRRLERRSDRLQVAQVAQL